MVKKEPLDTSRFDKETRFEIWHIDRPDGVSWSVVRDRKLIDESLGPGHIPVLKAILYRCSLQRAEAVMELLKGE